MGDPFRRPPPLPPLRHDPAAYKTYRIHQGRDTTVVAACREAGCVQWHHGWDTVIDERTELAAGQALYIRTQSGRTFRESRTDAGWTVFHFEPYQRCFQEHRTQPQRFAVVGGVGHVNPLGTPPRIHARPEDWVEDCAETLDGIRTAQERG